MNPGIPTDSSEDLNAAVRRLSLDSLDSGSTLALKVTSRSMAPVLMPDDIIELRQVDPASLYPGDLVTFIQGDVLVTHRIVDRMADRWRTKGDRNAYLDPLDQQSSLVGLVINRRRKNAAGMDKITTFTTPRFQRTHRVIARLSRLEGYFYDRLLSQSSVAKPAWKKILAWLVWRAMRLFLRALWFLEA